MSQFVKFICTVSLLVPLVSCVQVQIKPKEIVTDTVSAGKSLYQTIKHRRDGTEERLYAHSLPLSEGDDMVAVAKECQDFLKVTAENASEQEMEVLEESTEVAVGEVGSKLICRLRAVV